MGLWPILNRFILQHTFVTGLHLDSPIQVSSTLQASLVNLHGYSLLSIKKNGAGLMEHVCKRIYKEMSCKYKLRLCDVGGCVNGVLTCKWDYVFE